MTDTAPPPRPRLATLLVAVAVALWLANFPRRLDFPAFAFGDLGASLTAHDLVGRGYRPGLDFALRGGLLPVPFGRAWFGLLGRSPMASYAAMGLIGAWMAWNLARVAASTRAGRSGWALLAVGLPYSIPSSFPDFAHGLEAGLLAQALAEHARGRRGVALAWVVAAVLARPGLGTIYGPILAASILGNRRRVGSRGSIFGRDAFGPAIATVLALGGSLGLAYGIDALARSALPTTGLAGDSLTPRSFTPGSVAGSGLAGSVALGLAGVLAASRGFRDPAGGFVGTCALVHVLVGFERSGHAWSDDGFVLAMGLAAASSLGRGWRGATWALVAVAALGLRTPLASAVDAWREKARSSETSGLWAIPAERAEWVLVRRMAGGRRSVVLASSGCAELLAREFAPAVTPSLVPGTEAGPDLPRKAGQLAGAGLVVVPKYLGNERVVEWPAFSGVMGEFKVAFDGVFYRVYERR